MCLSTTFVNLIGQKETWRILLKHFYRNVSHRNHVPGSFLLRHSPRLPIVYSVVRGQRRRISLPVRGAGYKLLTPFRGCSAKLKRERNQPTVAVAAAAGQSRAVQSFHNDNTSTPFLLNISYGLLDLQLFIYYTYAMTREGH